MNAELVQKISHQVHGGGLSFPDAVRALLSNDVEYYHVDFATLQTTYHATSGAVVTTPLTYEGLPGIAPAFDAAKLKAAILDSQRHGQPYREFTLRAMEAGVMGYVAFLRGRRVTYLGRDGDQHIEWFPGVEPRTPTG